MSLQDYLYSQETVTGVLNEYIKELLQKNNIESILHANKLKAYQNTINDHIFIKDLRKLFNETYDFIEKKHPELQFIIAGRRKSLISTENKINQYFCLNKSLDLIRDFFAFRIILFGNNSRLNLIKHCYDIMSEIIEFMVIKNFTPCERLPLLGVPNINDHKNNYFSSFKYKHFIKDYICFPKENGYQSIHLVLIDTKGRYLEIQIRTLEMHSIIESGLANHQNYKKEKYPTSLKFDRDKICINGYTTLNNKVFDYAGVEFPMIIFQRQKTF